MSRQRTFNQRGASSVEYALILILVSLAIILGATYFGARTGALFTDSCASVASASGGGCP